MSNNQRPIIPIPSNKEVENLWTNFTSDIPSTSKSRTFFIPHAGLKYSGHCSLEALSLCIPKPNKIWIFGTNHRPSENLNDTMFKNIDKLLQNPIKNNNIESILLENSTDALREHSIMMNSALLKYRFPKAKIYPWLIPPDKWLDNTIIQILTKYIVKFLKENPNHIVIFSSDMSHEDQVEHGSQSVIDKEADIISDILNGILLPSQRNNYLTMCGPENLALFISVSNSMGEYPVIRCYDDSLGKRQFWTTKSAERVVSYLSMVSFKSKKNVIIDNQLWIITFLKSFILSSIYSSLSPPTLANPEFPKQFSTGLSNGLFITIMDRSTRATRACIGEFFKKGISMDQHILDIIPRLITDAKNRWDNPIRQSDIGGLLCEFTILDNTSRKISSTLQKPNISFSSKMNGSDNMYMIESNSKHGTFIPDVWKSHPDWTAKYYILQLLEKTGASVNLPYVLYSRKTIII